MNERAAILAALTASASWTSLVAADNTKWREAWGRNGLEASTAPFNSTTGKLTACAELTISTRSRVNLPDYGEQSFFTLWVYHDYDFNAVNAALYAAKRILNNTYLPMVDNHGTPLLRWSNDIAEFTADELQGAAGGSSRYVMLAGWH